MEKMRKILHIYKEIQQVVQKHCKEDAIHVAGSLALALKLGFPKSCDPVMFEAILEFQENMGLF